ncbi:MAG: hypothetical protein ACLGIV_15440 [Actinomycetes bacterium]
MTDERDPKQAWTDTGERLGALGARLKQHYEQASGKDAETERAELASAVERLTEVVREAFDAVGEAARDPAVREDVKGVGESLGAALSASFEELRRGAGR